MTTVAYKNGVMAADTMMSRGNEFAMGAVKIFKTGRFLVGVSGAYANMEAFRNFLTEHEDEVRDAGDLCRYWDDAPDYGGFCALLVDAQGRIWTAVDAPPVLVPASFDAIGSGGPYAMGAMQVGASAQDAVRAARKLDVHTGGNITIVRLN